MRRADPLEKTPDSGKDWGQEEKAWWDETVRWEYQTTWSASWETCMQVRNQQLELDMEQQTGSK